MHAGHSEGIANPPRDPIELLETIDRLLEEIDTMDHSDLKVERRRTMHLPHAIKAANRIVSRSSANDISLLIENHIEPHPHWSTPGEARTIIGSVPVWAIIGYLEAVKGDTLSAAADYDLHPDAVEAAAAYYHRHRDAVEARISANADTPSLLSV